MANAWMTTSGRMEFNPDTVRNEMVDFWAVATSPVAVNKFFHTVLSGWVLGSVFVVGISCWYLLKKRNREFALASIKNWCYLRTSGIVTRCLDRRRFRLSDCTDTADEAGCCGRPV